MIKHQFNAQHTRTLLWLLAGLIFSFNTLSVWHSAAHVSQQSIVQNSNHPTSQHLDDHCLLCQSAHQFNTTLPAQPFYFSVDIAATWQFVPSPIHLLATPLFSSQARAPPSYI